MSKITIIIPAYNEEKRIGPTLDAYVSFYREYPEEIDFLVVMNGCQDKTLDVVKSRSERYLGAIDWIFIPERLGKGGGLREGFKKAKGDLIGFADADNSVPPQEFNKLIKVLLNNPEVDGAISSRLKKGSQVIGESWFRKNIVSKVFAFLVRLVCGLPYRDTQCGGKILRKELVWKLLANWHITNMAFDVELLWNAKKIGAKIEEIPIVWTEKGESATLGSFWGFINQSLRMVWSLLKIRFGS